MRIAAVILAITGLLFFGHPACADNSDDEESGGGNQALTGALMGGLLGGGVGTAIGSASGNAGKGALIGAGVGAVGGALLGANQQSKKPKANRNLAEPEPGNVMQENPEMPSNLKVKKRVVKEYDKEGNLVSEKEVKN